MTAFGLLAATTTSAARATSTTTAPAAAGSWRLSLTTPSTGAVNVVQRAGALRLADPGRTALASPTAVGALVGAPHRLSTATSRVDAEVAAQTPAGTAVTVWVRGRSAGAWSEWTPAGQRLAAPARVVQVRLELRAGPHRNTPQVRSVTLRPGPAQARIAAARTPATARVFATREGLVGATTANGHTIASADHFVALPSGRALAPSGQGSYTVRVCAESSPRCEWAPVWDVGPWNTRDDYWNPAATRETYTDLPQGKPEAQAAYSEGYNGGHDGFGRAVSNPAGIDLADGTFTDGVGLTDNAWVKVTYLWTAPAKITGTVATELNVRTGPHAAATAVGRAAERATVPIVCQATGDTVAGTVKKSNLWDELAPGYFVSDAHVDTGSTKPVAPAC